MPNPKRNIASVLSKIFICCGLLIFLIYSITNLEWYYYIWDTSYYEKVQDTYLSQFPKSRAVSVESSHLSTITIESKDFFSLPKAVLYINENEIADFRNGKVTVIVKHGDRLFIDTSFYERELTFEIVSVTGQVSYPLSQTFINIPPTENLSINVEFTNPLN
ncbi:MAG: hypothetical protein AB1420_00510 [Bacillota bacterium]